jgi:hypothetical protein
MAGLKGRGFGIFERFLWQENSQGVPIEILAE